MAIHLTAIQPEGHPQILALDFVDVGDNLVPRPRLQVIIAEREDVRCKGIPKTVQYH